MSSLPDIPAATDAPLPVESAPATGVPGIVDHLFRRQAGQVVATLTRILGLQHLELVEDSMQEALIKALRLWPLRGVPANPAGWITQVAKRAALDALRRDRSLREKSELLAQELAAALVAEPPSTDILDHQLRDDQLRMLFTCCSPLLPREAQVALTLKTLGGLSVREIASAFLTEETTIAQRIVRAKRLLRERAVDFFDLDTDTVAMRLDAVLAVLYLMFNEGYSAHQGEDLVRHDLVEEALRLAALVAHHPSGAPQAHALLALMLFQAARLPSRADGLGNLILLEDQDRRLWDRQILRAALSELNASARGVTVSAYHLEAEIASYHALARSYAETNWVAILRAYDDLLLLAPTPVVALNRAVALAHLDGPEAGLAEIARIQTQPGMASYHLLHASAGDLYRRLGRREKAAASYQRALRHATSGPDQRFLRQRLAALEAPD
jgi:RNA polymerase sigma factor (sigma-70 family)